MCILEIEVEVMMNSLCGCISRLVLTIARYQLEMFTSEVVVSLPTLHTSPSFICSFVLLVSLRCLFFITVVFIAKLQLKLHSKQRCLIFCNCTCLWKIKYKDDMDFVFLYTSFYSFLFKDVYGGTEQAVSTVICD